MTASTEPKPTITKSSSRRALLAGALGGIGAVAAGAVGRVSPVRGADGETILVGGEYVATSRTYLENTTNSDTVFEAVSTSGRALRATSTGYIAIQGASTNYVGVLGQSSGYVGVYGSSTTYTAIFGTSGAPNHPALRGQAAADSTGIVGSSGASLPDAKPKTGVYGYANQDSGSRGVFGRSPKGHGLHGEATTGVGLFGKAKQGGFALRTRGRIKAEQVSGVATIPAGNPGVTVDPGVNVTSASFVLLTPKANIGSRGLWFTTNASADTFRIRISSSRSSNTKVAWLLLG